MANMDNSSLQALQTEVDFYRQNQAIVEQEIRTLISDNQKLSHQVGNLMKENLQYAQQAHTNDHSKEVEELKTQITLITKERDSLHVLWQTSQKTIDALETELETYQNYNGRSNNQNTVERRRDLELKLDTALSDYLEVESKYKTVITERNTLESEVKDRTKEISLYKERNKTLEAELEALKKELAECKIELIAEKKSHEDIRSQLQICQKECLDKIKREAEAKLKVAEALQLFDLVSSQKNEALKKYSQATHEILDLKDKLVNIKRDTEASFRSELDEVKQNYNEKMSDMLQHIRNLDTELVEKGLLLNKAMRETKILQAANENYFQQQKDNLNAVDSKVAMAEQKLESMVQELVSSERRSIQLMCEKQRLALDLQRTLDNNIREGKRRDWEEGLLKTECQELKLQVEHLQKSLTETQEIINKQQTILTSRTEFNNRLASTKEEEFLELNKQLENQMELNKKWKESYIDMTEKLKQKLETLNRENRELRLQLNLPYLSSQDNSVAS